jgi:hypothetical protein
MRNLICLQDSLFTSLRESGFLRVINNSVPISNTPESSLLRAATLEAIVARWLAEALFQPLFPWSSHPDEPPNMLEDLLDSILSVHDRKGPLLLSILATTTTKEGENRSKKIIVQIRNEVVKLCRPILTSSEPDRFVEFQSDLEDYLLEAVDIWNNAQRMHSSITARADVVNKASTSEDVGLWAAREEHDQLGQIEDHVPDEPIKALYPCIFQHLQNDQSLLFAGCALWSDQNLYVVGQREFQVQSTRISSGTRRLNVS